MKRLTWGVMALVSIVALASCNEESWVHDAGKGGIRLNLQASGEVKDAVPVLRSGKETLQAPSPEEFAIVLDKADGSYSHRWESLSDFNAEKDFSAGAYTLTAVYGDETQEGFDVPCFKGTTSVNVMEGRESDASVVATLANSMVSVDYTDAFKGYFTKYSAGVHSEGHDYIEFEATETRPAYLVPGEVAVQLTMTNASGKEVTLQPAAFAAQAAHHYHITFDVNNGQVGQATLVVKFDDSLVQEDVTIDLTEELFTTPAPDVKASGFTHGQTIEVLEGTKPESSYKYQVLARGGLQSVILTVNSADYTPVFGNEIDLMAASESQRAQLEAAGIDCAGLWKNPDRMALVDITGFCAALPAGAHKVTLMAKDRFTRVSEAVTLNVDVAAVTITAKANDLIFGSGTATVDINYNGAGANEAFTFKALDNYGKYVPCEVAGVETLNTRSFPSSIYRFTINVPDTERAELPIAVYYRGNLLETLKAKVITPSYSVSVDPYATSAYISVTPDEAANLRGIVNNMRIYVGGQKVPESNLTRDAQQGIIYLAGLKGATEYHLQTSLVEGSYATDEKFTTEAAAGVPNGDFETLAQTISTTINSGGTWSNSSHWTAQQNKLTFDVSEPTGWASVNAKTCNLSAKTLNTWFCVPSTMNVSDAKSGSTAMLIRSVGYDYAGSVPGRSSNTAFSGDHKYSDKTATVANRAAGKLFIGSYAINTSTMAETYTQGVGFTSRPSALKGWYKYTAYDSDNGVVNVQLYNGSTLVASGSARLDAASGYTEFEVPLTYEVSGMRPTRLCVMISSTADASDNYQTETSVVKAGAVTELTQSYIGSQLTVDNLTFVYGRTSMKAKARRNVRK